MKRFLLFVSVLVLGSMPVKAATSLSSVLFTNLNAQYFLLSLGGNPTNMVALTYQRAGTNLASINPTIGRVPYKGSATALADTAIEYVDANTVSVPEMDLGSMVVTNLTNGGPVISLTSGVVTNIPHGTGALTNDGAGNMGYYDYSTRKAANWVGSSTTNSTLPGTATAHQIVVGESYTGSTRTYQGALGNGTSFTIDMSLTNRVWSCFPTGSVTFALSNPLAGKSLSVLLVNTNATNIAITFPAEAVFNGYKPAELTAGKQGQWWGTDWTISATNRLVSTYGEEQQ